MGKHKSDRAYLHLESKEVMKVQRLNDNKVVVHFPSGPERVLQHELDKEFEHLGGWEDYQSGLLSSREL